MKNSFIPINNDIDKTIAFAQSLDQNFIKNNRIKQPQHYINTLDVLENLQNQGWLINGVCENRGRNRKISDHYVRLEHQDFTIREKGKLEGVANLYISNSCDGKKPFNMDFGIHRLVCSNGLIRRDSYVEFNLKHNETSLRRVPMMLENLNQSFQKSLNEFTKLKDKELAPHQIQELAANAALLRFEKNSIDTNQLLKSHRSEDEGNSLWNVYNRIQENLTKHNLLVDVNGRQLSGVSSVKEDIKVNQDLFELVEDYI